MSDDFKRCAICDHCNLGNEEKRKFVLDKSTQDYHCSVCASAINDAVMDYDLDELEWDVPIQPYWKRTDAHRRGGLKFRKKDIVDE